MAPLWPHGTPRPCRSSSSQILENCADAANSWIPADGRSRTRTWDLFLIRRSCVSPPVVPTRSLIPAHRASRRVREGTGEDWRGQAGGPTVATRPQFEGKASYDPEADITPTIRSSPDARWSVLLRACMIASTAASLGAWSSSSITCVSSVSQEPWPSCRDIQPSARHAASTASLAFVSQRQRGCEETGAAGDDLVASQSTDTFGLPKEGRARPTRSRVRWFDCRAGGCSGDGLDHMAWAARCRGCLPG